MDVADSRSILNGRSTVTQRELVTRLVSPVVLVPVCQGYHPSHHPLHIVNLNVLRPRIRWVLNQSNPRNLPQPSRNTRQWLARLFGQFADGDLAVLIQGELTHHH
jgi:hypothetical protein